MRRATRLALSTIPSLLLIVVVEIFLTVVAPVSDPYEELKQTGVGLNQYIKSEYQPNLRLSMTPEEGLPGVEGSSVFSTNNMGYRGHDIIVPKPANEFRVFLVGGSTIETMVLDDSKSIDRVLEQHLNETSRSHRLVRVYNAGRSGDRSYDHISMLVHRIAHLQPDMVIVLVGVNDLIAATNSTDYLHRTDKSLNKMSLSLLLRMVSTEFQLPRRIRHAVTGVGETLGLRPAEVPAGATYREMVRFTQSLPALAEPPRVDLVSYEENLKTIVGVGRGHGFQVILMTQPSTWNSQVDMSASEWHWMNRGEKGRYREELMDDALGEYNSVTVRVAHLNGTLLYDLASQMPKSSEFIYDDVHFNYAGAKRIGLGLANMISADWAMDE